VNKSENLKKNHIQVKIPLLKIKEEDKKKQGSIIKRPCPFPIAPI